MLWVHFREIIELIKNGPDIVHEVLVEMFNTFLWNISTQYIKMDTSDNVVVLMLSVQWHA